MSHALATVLHRGRRPRVTSWRRAWHPHGKGAGKRAAWKPVAPRRSAGTETETGTGLKTRYTGFKR